MFLFLAEMMCEHLFLRSKIFWWSPNPCLEVMQCSLLNYSDKWTFTLATVLNNMSTRGHTNMCSAYTCGVKQVWPVLFISSNHFSFSQYQRGVDQRDRSLTDFGIFRLKPVSSCEACWWRILTQTYSRSVCEQLHPPTHCCSLVSL